MVQNLLLKIKKAGPCRLDATRLCLVLWNICNLAEFSTTKIFIYMQIYFLIFRVSISLFNRCFNAISKPRMSDAYFKPEIENIIWQCFYFLCPELR